MSTNGGANFVPVSDLFTFNDGAFVLGQTKTEAGTYVYRVTYAGTIELASSVSNRVTVNVGAAAGSQTVSQAASQTVGESNPSSNDVFTVDGFVNERVNGTGIATQFFTV